MLSFTYDFIRFITLRSIYMVCPKKHGPCFSHDLLIRAIYFHWLKHGFPQTSNAHNFLIRTLFSLIGFFMCSLSSWLHARVENQSI